jgi:hypothetical protein
MSTTPLSKKFPSSRARLVLTSIVDKQWQGVLASAAHARNVPSDLLDGRMQAEQTQRQADERARELALVRERQAARDAAAEQVRASGLVCSRWCAAAAALRVCVCVCVFAHARA